MERYYYERDRRHDRDRGVEVHQLLADDRPSVYVVYDRRNGHYNPIAYVPDCIVAERIVDALNGINTRDAAR